VIGVGDKQLLSVSDLLGEPVHVRGRDGDFRRRPEPVRSILIGKKQYVQRFRFARHGVQAGNLQLNTYREKVFNRRTLGLEVVDFVTLATT
jgi:hypothetical protein